MHEELVPVDTEWLCVRDLVSAGAEDEASSLLRTKLGCDGKPVVAPHELRTNGLVALSGFATGG